MKKNLLFSCAISLSFVAGAQVSSPFTACPEIVAVSRPGNNTYSNEPVSFYKVNNTTGAATLISDGPLKNPAAPANNMDLNATGLNAVDGYLYGMGANTATTQKFYRAGSNYSVQQAGVITAPSTSGFFEVSAVNPAAGEFDASDNYFFTAVKGTGIPFPAPTFFPSDFYIGKISNVSGLPAGTANITPAYTAVDFSAAACSPYYLTLVTAVTEATATNTGLRDLVFNPRDGKLYTYVSFEFPSGSGLFFGELLNINTTTGAVTCYNPSLLSFASATNEVAGLAMTTTGAIQILFTNGNIYKTVFTAPNTYSGAITLLGASGMPTALRGDMAACVTASGPLPVKFVSTAATERNCMIDLKWTVAEEQSVSRYDVEQLDNNHATSVTHISATGSLSEHTYHASIPVNAKTMMLRVRETDNDGSYAYSDVVTVNTNCTKTKTITIIDNASVTNNLQIRWNNIVNTENCILSIYNETGALVMKKSVTTNSSNSISNIDVAGFSPGLYLIAVQFSSGEKLTERFVKK